MSCKPRTKWDCPSPDYTRVVQTLTTLGLTREQIVANITMAMADTGLKPPEVAGPPTLTFNGDPDGTYQWET